MTPEEEEIPRRVMDAWNRRDLDAALALAAPDITYVNAPEAIEPGTRHGAEEFATVMEKQWEGLVGVRHDMDRVHVRGDEVITEGRISRAMPDSGAKIENRVLLSWTIRDGKVTRLAVLGAGSEFHNAREEAGLGE